MKAKTIFSPRKMLIWIILIVLTFSVSLLQKPSQSNLVAIITAVAIELSEDNEYKTSVQILTPAQATQRSDKIFTGKGESLAHSMGALAVQVGKELGFAHCEVVMIGDNLSGQGIIEVLDYLTRTRKIGRNALLVNFSGEEVDKFMVALTHLSGQLSLDFADILQDNEKNLFTSGSTVEKFYQDYYNQHGASFIPKISISTDEYSGIEVPASDPSSQSTGSGGQESGAQDSQGSQDSQGGGQQKKYFKNDGATSLFLNGKKIAELEVEDVVKLNYFASRNIRCHISLYNITDELYDHADIVLFSRNKSIKTKYYFKDNLPHLKIKLHLDIIIEQVKQEKKSKEFLARNQKFFTKTVQEEMEKVVKKDMNDALDLLREYNTDIIKVYKRFNELKQKQWQEYYNALPEPKNYLKDIVLEVEVDAKIVA